MNPVQGRMQVAMQRGVDAHRGKHKGMSIPINMWAKEKEDNRNKKRKLMKTGGQKMWTSILVELNVWLWCMLESPDPRWHRVVFGTRDHGVTRGDMGKSRG